MDTDHADVQRIGSDRDAFGDFYVVPVVAVQRFVARLEHGDDSDAGTAPLPEARAGGPVPHQLRRRGRRDRLTLRLPASVADSEAVLHITTSGTAEGWSGIAVWWEGVVC